MINKLQKKAYINGYSSVGGKEEHRGPLGAALDHYDESDRFGQDTWEKSESEMQRVCLSMLFAKTGKKPGDIDLLFAGDLINQCTSSTYGLIDFDIPYIGIFGACSTAAEGLALAALSCSADYAKNAAVVTSSHFCSAERQFRFPLEYGSQRTPTSQHTATAAGAFLIGSENQSGDPGVYIDEVMFGITNDGGITDANNMGAAMAPAVIDTLTRYFKESGSKPDDFDLILTGDLGYEGYTIVKRFMSDLGSDVQSVLYDCGLMIYNRSLSDMHAGGSGCGCSAFALAASVIPDIKNGKYKDVLFLGTGALLSKASVLQGATIPSVAHLVRLRRG